MRHSVVRRQDAKILNGRLGAGDENLRGDIAGDGEEDHVMPGGGDYRDLGPQHAALAAALRGARLRRAVRPAAGEAGPEARPPGTDGRCAAVISGEVRGTSRCGGRREAPHCCALLRSPPLRKNQQDLCAHAQNYSHPRKAFHGAGASNSNITRPTAATGNFMGEPGCS